MLLVVGPLLLSFRGASLPVVRLLINVQLHMSKLHINNFLGHACFKYHKYCATILHTPYGSTTV